MTADPDDHLTPFERLRRAAHRDVDRICDTWPHAVVDAHARGFPSAVMQPGQRGSAELTSVEAAACQPDFAAGWLAELGDVIVLFGMESTDSGRPWTGETIRWVWHTAVEMLLEVWPDHANRTTQRLHYLAESARTHWPEPPRRGEKISGVSVGERGNDVETCGLCQNPVMGGRGDPIRRIDGEAFHKSPCWYAVTSDRAGRATR